MFRRKIIITLLCVLFVVVITRIYFHVTGDFRLGNISYDQPYRTEWDFPLKEGQQQLVDTILSQQFKFLGKGSQGYAFTSDDRHYVLKFFKFKHLTPPFALSFLPDIPPFADYKEKKKAQKLRKLNRLFEGYRLAYEKVPEQSGLVFLQLNPSHVTRYVTVFDKSGFKHTIDLGKVPFLIQKKAKDLRTVLREALAQGNVTLAKERLSQIIDLYVSQYQQGLYDQDFGVMHNTGFIEEQPIRLDLGQLAQDDNMKQSAVYQKNLTQVVNKMIKWIRKNAPEHESELVSSLQNKISTLFVSSNDFK